MHSLEERRRFPSKIQRVTESRVGLVSVIIPTRNRNTLLRATIESVLSQTYRNFEIIVIDDGSNDGTDQTVREIVGQHPAVSIQYEWVKPRGCAHARNLGLSLANGEYIQHLDSDDLLEARKFEEQVKFLRLNPQLDAVYSFCFIVDGDSPPNKIGKRACQPRDLLDFILRPWIPILDPISVLWKSRSLADSGGYNESLTCWIDWEHSVRFLARSGTIGCLPRALSCYRVHENRVTSKWSRAREDSIFTALYSVYHVLRECNLEKHFSPLSERVWLQFPHFQSDPEKREGFHNLLENLSNGKGQPWFIRQSIKKDGVLRSNAYKVLVRLYSLRLLVGRFRATPLRWLL